MKILKSPLYIKIGGILLISMLLLIPTSMLQDLVRERQQRQEETVSEISQQWGKEQTITGPFISIPFTRTIKQTTANGGYQYVPHIDYIHVLPEKLEIETQIDPQVRYRGIYETVVYDSDIQLKGNFAPIDIKDLEVDPDKIKWDKARLVIGFSDLHGIESTKEVKWGDTSLNCLPGIGNRQVVETGIHAKLDTLFDVNQSASFSISVELKGSSGMWFTPLGKETSVVASSSWKDPSFLGAFLPDEREVSPEGFRSNWNVLHLNRSFPQVWKGSKYTVEQSEFGVQLLQPVDHYRKSLRTMKYALLFVGFTFLTFFFVEILKKKNMHPMQYILVGLALVVFYSLLLAISEHLGYDVSFLISSVATITLVSLYVRSVLNSSALMSLISGVLVILYGFIYVVMQLQDYALLIGSCSIFMVLALVMFLSSKVNWNEIGNSENELNKEQ